MTAGEQEQRELLLVVVLAGVASFATSLGGLLAASGVWLVGPVLGIGAIVAFIFFVRTRPARRLKMVAGLGLSLAVLSIVIPGWLLYVFSFAGD